MSVGIRLALVALFCVSSQAAEVHSTDRDGDYSISLTEILRTIQLFGLDGYHCADGSEDGFAPGPGTLECGAHDSDYAPQDGRISLGEILRVIQIYNGHGYFACAEGEDRFCLRRDGELVMPFLTAFAANGTNFTRAWSASSWTRPSMTGLLSGQYPNRYMIDLPPTGLNQTTRFNMGPEVETLVEWLNRYGFDPWEAQTNASLPEIGYVQGVPSGQMSFLNGGPSGWVTDTLIAKLPHWGAPFLVYAHYMDAHGPYAPAKDLVHPFAAEPVLSGTDAVYLDYAFWGNYTRDLLYAYLGADPREYADLSPVGVEVLQSRYDRDCYNLDKHLGRLVETTLAAHPNTFVVVTADHGDTFFDRDATIGHGHTLYEEQIHVPLIFHGPGIPAQEIDRRVSNISVMPTIARLLEISPELHWEGRDLFTDVVEEPLYAYTRSTFLGATVDISAVLDRGLKLIDDPNKHGAMQLFELAADPGERVDIAGERPEAVLHLKELLDTHRAAVAPR